MLFNSLLVGRSFSLLALTVWGLLVAAQLGWIGRDQWGFNLWGYLPTGVAVPLAVSALALCSAGVREAVAERVARGAARPLPGPRWMWSAVAAAGVGTLLWVLRERYLYADSVLMLFSRLDGWNFYFPEMGATYLMKGSVDLGRALGAGVRSSARLGPCLLGSLAVYLVYRLGCRLAPGRGGLAVLFLLSGGLLRIFAGHVEVYAYLLTAVLIYLVTALAYLEGRVAWVWVCLAFGFSVWVHAATVSLAPSLLYLALRGPEGQSLHLRLLRATPGLLLGALPLLLFLSLALVLGRETELGHMWMRVRELLGQSREPDAVRWWVRGWGGEGSIGTDVVLFSPAQWKYLANAFHLLVPATLPVLVVFACWRPRAFVATPRVRFLGFACAPLVVYAFALRPFWGPYDWDLFSNSALCLAALAFTLLATELPRPHFRPLMVVLIGFQIAFVGAPWLLQSVWTVREAGPFMQRPFSRDLLKPATPAPDDLKRWL